MPPPLPQLTAHDHRRLPQGIPHPLRGQPRSSLAPCPEEMIFVGGVVGELSTAEELSTGGARGFRRERTGILEGCIGVTFGVM